MRRYVDWTVARPGPREMRLFQLQKSLEIQWGGPPSSDPKCSRRIHESESDLKNHKNKLQRLRWLVNPLNRAFETPLTHQEQCRHVMMGRCHICITLSCSMRMYELYCAYVSHLRSLATMLENSCCRFFSASMHALRESEASL